ncbi:MAG: ATP-dependent sacrificial sulfur transferase LarE [Lachnospiraceae bacterium]|nr:ATP-dependent sacrificial sulfur transferase LarE [Lachnospiraceae bacterium]
MRDSALQGKYNDLLQILKGYGRLAVAFSGGVDSTFLLKAANQALGRNVLAITAHSEFFPRREMAEARDFCNSEGIDQFILYEKVLEIEGIRNNPPDRCYLCKKNLFTKILELSHSRGFDTVAEGSNLDDLSDFRPGMKAIAELGIQSPLKAAQLTKSEIRALSKKLGLKTFDKPSFACLASRFVHGEIISEKKLEMVDRAEELLLRLGFSQFRVRIHGEDLARIEVPKSELEKLINNSDLIVSEFKDLGFHYVSADLGGYRTGSMNPS